MNMSNHQNKQKNRIVVFTRYPVPGRTKTRLIPRLGSVRAADLQRLLTEKTLSTVKSIKSHKAPEVEVCFEGGSLKKMRQWLGPEYHFSRQVVGDLGDRMNASFVQTFKDGCNRVVLLGSDIPGIELDHIEKAFEGLDTHDMVIGPSSDGGYWLVGLKNHVDIFHDIDWGSSLVLKQTLIIAKELGLNVFKLDTLTDIDTVEDLMQWRPQGVEKEPFVSVIIPALNESQNIEAAIDSAWNEDAEVIVVDGGSYDDTVKRAVAAGAFVETSLPGRATQQNCGAECARGRALLFLHADTRLPDNYISLVFDILLDTGVVAGAFRFKTDLNSPLMRIIECMTNCRSKYLKLPYGDQGVFFRKSLFDSLGGFPNVPIAEDLIFLRAISKYGRVRIAEAHAVTSARRWQKLGMIRTVLINQLIVAGLCMGIAPSALASLYRTQHEI
ncbi:MAG: DUF2064 domain-containing protein [Desulfobacterales bacterium]|nr:DUF2064 domain-containing protein [Desulfobacterales bacterium]